MSDWLARGKWIYERVWSALFIFVGAMGLLSVFFEFVAAVLVWRRTGIWHLTPFFDPVPFKMPPSMLRDVFLALFALPRLILNVVIGGALVWMGTSRWRSAVSPKSRR